MTTFKIAVHRVCFVEKPDKEPGFSWDLFNDGFENREVDVMDLCDSIYRGFSLAPWMDGRRKIENFQLAQHIGVDLDTEDKRSEMEELARHPLVMAYGAIIYETPTHTPYLPRARVIFPLDEPIRSAEGYKMAIQVVTELFDGPDPSCVDAARFFFGNGKLGFYRHTDGIWFNPDACLPVSELRRMARLRLQRLRNQHEQSHRESPPPTTSPSDEVMPLSDMADRLHTVDPYRMDYREWAKIVAALGHVYGFGAFTVARNWSDKPGKTPLSEKKWRSLIKDHPKAAGYGTLMWALKEYNNGTR
jgi:hypothetical protein